MRLLKFSKTATYIELLRNPNFRLLWLGQAITTFGSFFTRIAIPIYVYELTDRSYGQLGFSFFVSLLPALLFGLFAGALVDRWDRRRTMIYTDILSSLCLGLLIVAVSLPIDNVFKLVSLYVIAFLTSLLREMFHPARIAIFTEVVSDDQLLTANSLDQSTTTLGEFLSYPLAVLALSQLGFAVTFSIDAASFLLSALLIWGVRVQQRVPEAPEDTTIWKEIGQGLSIVKQSPLLRKVAILSFIVPATFTLLATLQLPFAVEWLGSTQEVGFPALEASMAIGLVLGTLILGYWGQHIARWKLLSFGLLSFGIVVAMVGLLPQFGGYLGIPQSEANNPWTPLLLIAMPLVLLQGSTNSMIVACTRTVMQEETPRAVIGRVASVITVAAGVGGSVGALLTGFAEGRAAGIITGIGVFLGMLGLIGFWWLRTPPAPPSSTGEALQQPIPEQSF